MACVSHNKQIIDNPDKGRLCTMLPINYDSMKYMKCSCSCKTT